MGLCLQGGYHIISSTVPSVPFRSYETVCIHAVCWFVGCHATRGYTESGISVTPRVCFNTAHRGCESAMVGHRRKRGRTLILVGLILPREGVNITHAFLLLGMFLVHCKM